MPAQSDLPTESGQAKILVRRDADKEKKDPEDSDQFGSSGLKPLSGASAVSGWGSHQTIKGLPVHMGLITGI